eukprot:gnl/TRDRNA2_/TRDRNA2_38437_c0_seq1.p1 gnl/TRDRNA2_/TRDRNA2_38437_c0~~gnl/TRDRNA2_/TRDRNA2_38437_c0_seq1.p1  ORF type:complete len:436 (+),score=62.16 gnl/TRDRNA2_/TRDRNA2_38437_c0_seq1:59-1366(+)
MPPAEQVPFRDGETGIVSKILHPGDDGLEDVPIRDRRWQWARPQVEGVGPCARGGHAATLVGPTNSMKASARIFLFGGHYDASEEFGGFQYLNDTHVLDIDENLWTTPRCRGTTPEPRYGHSAALVGTRIVYFGGKGKGKHFRDLHALDASTMTWFQGPSSGGAPSARHGHSATLHGTRLFVFGGVCGAKYFGDLHCLDLASMAWSSPQTSGPKPSARFGHTALLIGDSLMVHGGFCMESADIGREETSGSLLKACYLNDIRVLDINRMLWSRLRTHGEPPTGRFGHTLVLSDDDAIVFGGWAGKEGDAAGVAFSLKNKVKDGGESPKSNEDQSCNYCYTLRTSDMRWVPVKYSGVPASRRYGHSTTAIGPHLIIIGGWDGGKPLMDVIVLRDRTVGKTEEQNLLFEQAEGVDGPEGYVDGEGYGDGYEDDEYMQ